MESIELTGKTLQRKGPRSGFVAGVTCLLLLASGFLPASAQTFAEWWSQQKTQISYLYQQIAALQVYGSYVKQGYQISQNGLGSISGWAKGEFELHASHYRALRQINPYIKDDGRAVAAVKDLEAVNSQLSALAGVNGLTADDRKYLGQVRLKVRAECDAYAAKLELLMTPGDAQMTDDERLRRLDGIYGSVKDLLSFTSGFCSRVKALVMQREQAERDLKAIRRLYGIE